MDIVGFVITRDIIMFVRFITFVNHTTLAKFTFFFGGFNCFTAVRIICTDIIAVAGVKAVALPRSITTCARNVCYVIIGESLDVL